VTQGTRSAGSSLRISAPVDLEGTDVAERRSDVWIVRDRQDDAGLHGGLERQAGAHHPPGVDEHADRCALVEAVALQISRALRRSGTMRCTILLHDGTI